MSEMTEQEMIEYILDWHEQRSMRKLVSDKPRQLKSMVIIMEWEEWGGERYTEERNLMGRYYGGEEIYR
ncbi:MAG: hypothetical protein ROW48_18290 [Bellilinea sp.]|jgi:hypothetical protein